MKKDLLIIAVLLATIVSSCQKDDFCVDPITPELVIRLYDNDIPEEYKSVSSLYVWAEGKDTLPDYEGVSTDSIIVPLDPANDFTIYNLSSDDVVDQITVNYTRTEIFVSRSCGYKFNYENISLSDISNNWIIRTEITQENVTDETEHIKILH